MKSQGNQIVAVLLESREDELKDFALGMPRFDRNEELERYFTQANDSGLGLRLRPGTRHHTSSYQEAREGRPEVYARLETIWYTGKKYTAPTPYIDVDWSIDPCLTDHQGWGKISENIPLLSDADAQAFLKDLEALEKLVLAFDAAGALALTQAMRQKIQAGFAEENDLLLPGLSPGYAGA